MIKMCFLNSAIVPFLYMHFVPLVTAVPAGKLKHAVEPRERTSSLKANFVIDKQNFPEAYIAYQCHDNRFPSRHSLVKMKLL